MAPTTGAILRYLPPTLCTSFVGRQQLFVTWALRLAMSRGVRRQRVRGPRRDRLLLVALGVTVAVAGVGGIFA